jgi:acetyl-CoA synthase
MSRYIATRAIRGANTVVAEAEALLKAAIADLGPDTPVAFTNTAYFLPVNLAFMGRQIAKLSDMVPALEDAKRLLHPVPPENMWVPYLGETMDSGMATLLAEEIIEGIRFARGQEPQPITWDGTYIPTANFVTSDPMAKAGKRMNGPIDDIQLRAWGIQLVDGRMPGFAALIGCAKSTEIAVQIVRELQQRSILVFLSGSVNGRSIVPS